MGKFFKHFLTKDPIISEADEDKKLSPINGTLSWGNDITSVHAFTF